MKRKILQSKILVFIFFALISYFPVAQTNNTKQQIKIAKDIINCTYGLKDQNGNWIVEAKYTLIENLDRKNTRFKIFDGLNYGIIDNKGNHIVDFIYRQIGVYAQNDDCRFTVYNGKTYGIIDANGKTLIPLEYSQININLQKLLLLTKDGKYGIASNSGRIVFPANYKKINCIYDSKNFLLYENENNICYSTYADTTGKIFFQKEGYVQSFDKSGIAAYCEKFQEKDYMNQRQNIGALAGKFGIINEQGNIIIPQMYDYLSAYGGRITVTLDDKTGVVDQKNNYIIKPTYCVADMSDDYIPCKVSAIVPGQIYRIFDVDKVGVMNGDGHILVEPVYDYITKCTREESSFDMTYFIYKDGMQGTLSKDGFMTVKPTERKAKLPVKQTTGYVQQHPLIAYPKSNFQLVELNGKKNIINKKTGERIFKYNALDIKRADFSEFIFFVKPDYSEYPDYHSPESEKLWMAMDTSGKAVGKKEYSWIPYGKKDTAVNVYYLPTSKKNRSGIIDPNSIRYGLLTPLEEWLIPAVYKRMYEINKNRYLVWTEDGKYRVINRANETIIQLPYLAIEQIDSNLLLVQTKDLDFGIVTTLNETIIEPNFCTLEPVKVNYYNNDIRFNKDNGWNQPTWWLFKDDRKRLLYCSSGLQIPSSDPSDENGKKIDSLLRKYSIGSENRISFKIECNQQIPKDIDTTLIYKEVYNYLYPNYEKLPPCINPFYYSKDNITENCNWDIHNFRLLSIGKSYVSIYSLQDTYLGDNTDENLKLYYEKTYENFILEHDTLKKIVLTDLFGTEDILKDEIIRLLKTYESSTIDCQFVDDNIGMKNHFFYLTNAGIIVINSRYSTQSFELLIPIDRLLLYNESKWIVPYLMREK